MPRKPPTGPHADVAERFAFLLEAVGLDRDGLVAALDDAVTARSLFAVLAGDRRPSRSLAVLIERTFGFRAEHLLEGRGPMWTGPAVDEAPAGALTAAEQRLLAFARASVDNARLLDAELTRAETWAASWARVTVLLAELEQLARGDDPAAFPAAAEATLEECWRLAEAFRAWSSAMDQRRALLLTQQFVRRFLVQIPARLHDRGALDDDAAATVRASAEGLLAILAADQAALSEEIDRTADRIGSMGRPTATADHDLATQLTTLATRIERLRPLSV